jgi:hypothetical protein
MGHRPARFAPGTLLALLSACASHDAGGDGASVPVAPADASGGAADGAVVAAIDERRGIDGPAAFSAWPSDGAVVVACEKDSFGKNVSGLVYQPASATEDAVLWAVQNDPAKLYRLHWDGKAFVPVTSDAWNSGKLLRYPNAGGSPDAEGVTRTDWSSSEIYLVAERNNEMPDVARQSILRYEIGSTGEVLDATREWVLTDDLPAAEPNHGLEGIAWIPDAWLVERGFFDEHAQAIYAPASYPDHGSGIFLVGRDDVGMVYGYLLDHSGGGAVRVATFSSGQARSVDLTFDRDTATLWSLCDGACHGRMSLLDIDAEPASPTRGRFVVRATVPPPETLSSMNNEGIALAPLSECSANRRPFFWADDAASDGYAIRKGSITCGRLY